MSSVNSVCSIWLNVSVDNVGIIVVDSGLLIIKFGAERPSRPLIP